MRKRGLKTPVIKVDPANPSKDAIEVAAHIVRSGGLVVFPTETVYGILCLAEDKNAIRKLNQVKNRPVGKPYSLHIGYKKELDRYIERMPIPAKKIISKCWPGPITVLLMDKNGTKRGFRFPKDKVALALIRKVGLPVVAPSANISGFKSPVTAEEVASSLMGKVDLILDAGPTEYQKDSTIVDCSSKDPVVVREGVIKAEDLRKVWSIP